MALALCGIVRVGVVGLLGLVLLGRRQHKPPQSVHASPEPVAVEPARGAADERAEPLPLSVHPFAHVATAAGLVDPTCEKKKQKNKKNEGGAVSRACVECSAACLPISPHPASC